MWTGYLEIGGIEVADGERLRANIATGPCPSARFKPMVCNTIAEAREALGGIAPSFDRIDEAPWFDPQIPASGRLLGFELLEGKGLGDTRRSVTALEGLGDGQTFTAARKQGRESRFKVTVSGLDQGAIEYGRAWLSSILDGSRCGDESGPCGLFDVAWFSECPPDITDYPAAEPTPEAPYDVAAYLAALAKTRRVMLDCATTSGPIEGEILSTSGNLWTQDLEFTIGSELAGTYTESDAANVSSSNGPSPIVDFFRNLIENPRGIAASGNIEVGRNLVTNPSFETSASGWSLHTTAAGVTTSFARVGSSSAFTPADGSFCLKASIARSVSHPAGTELRTISSAAVSVTPGSTITVCAKMGSDAPNNSGQDTFEVWLHKSDGSGASPYSAVVPNRAGLDAGSRMFARVVVPAGFVTASIRVSRKALTSSINAGTGDLYIDGVSILSGDIASSSLFTTDEIKSLSPFGSAGMQSGLSFAWAGTANASQTIIRYSNPARWSSNAATTKVARISSGGRDALLVRSPGGAGVFAGPSMTLANVVAGSNYFPSIDARGWGGTSYVASFSVRWLTSLGAFISSTTFASSFPTGLSFSDSAWGTAAGGPVTAPANAARAEIVAEFDNLARRVLLSNAMLSPTQPATFFDGDTLDTPTRDYEWEGTRHASASSSTPIVSTVVVDPLADPSCPPVPTPPRPPVVDESCGTPVQSWSRFFYAIGSTGIPSALDFIPAFTITADRVLDAARISLLPNPEGLEPDALATDPVASWVLSYLPANTPLTIDSLHRQVTASIAGQELPADHLLTGLAGQPLTWPTLSCGQGYVLVIETPYQSAGGQIKPDVNVEGRVMYR